MRRLSIGSKATSKPWKLKIRRPPHLCSDVLSAFRAVYEEPKKRRALLFSNTVVTFIDQWDVAEEGDDLGGLTSEMYSEFWAEVLRPEAGLFEQAADRSGGYLPLASAPVEQLEAIGLVLVK